LIKLVEKKLKRSVPGILDMKPILAHTIEKAVAFDHAIYQMNYLSPPAAAGRSAQWLGTADGILSNPHWFTTWFEAEKRCRYFFFPKVFVRWERRPDQALKFSLGWVCSCE
jgi:hypothetical protein